MANEMEHDVLIIGAGAAGGAMAWYLSQRKVDAVCLEQGDWIAADLLLKRHIDWEVRSRRYWSPVPNVRQWRSDYPVASYGDEPVSVFLYNCLRCLKLAPARRPNLAPAVAGDPS